MVLAPKSKAKAKAQMRPTEADAASTVTEPWDLMAENEDDLVNSAAMSGLQDRVYQMENVMQEVLQRLRQHANP